MKEDRLLSEGLLDHLSQIISTLKLRRTMWDIHSDSSVVASGSEYGRMPGDRVHSARGMCLKCDNELSCVFSPDIDS
jgi:hypothetical protein